jgi:hypothetical protein
MAGTVFSKARESQVVFFRGLEKSLRDFPIPGKTNGFTFQCLEKVVGAVESMDKMEA